MVLGRVFMAVVCAAVTASLVTGKQGSILRERNGPEETTVFPLASADECSHAGCGCAHSVAHRSRVVTVFRHAAAEFIEMGKYLLFGAAASSALKLYLPQDIMGLFGDSVYLSVALMMGLAIVFSVCSEADAFVAASFWSFSRTAQLSFLVIGPMVDLKLIAAYGGVFDRRTGIVLTLTPVLLVYVLSVLLGGVGGVSL
jgi:uncharacterized protein